MKDFDESNVLVQFLALYRISKIINSYHYPEGHQYGREK